MLLYAYAHIGELVKDPDVITAIEELASKVILKPEVYDATTVLLGKSAEDILRDDKVIDKSRDFVADVMGMFSYLLLIHLHRQ